MISLKYLLGRKVDHFILDEVIGRGAMGTVFKASDTILDRTVALKLILKSDDSPVSLEAQKRLIREAQAAGRLSHPNIVTVHSYGETDEFQYISMEYVAGRNLAQIVADKKKLELAESLDILEQVLDAMAVASREGIVHRDIKPSNILVTGDGRVKVTDFGLARLNAASSLTLSGTILGTPHYMSPEQISGEPVDARSDIFSAGVVMYELLSGVKPFDGDSVSAVIYKIVNSEAAPIRTHNVRVPDFVAHIVEKAMSKDVLARYQTPEEMLGDIAAARDLQSRPGAGESSTIVRPPARKAAGAPDGRILPESDGERRPVAGHGARRIVLTVALLAAGAGILALFLYMKSPTVAPPVTSGTPTASSRQPSASLAREDAVPPGAGSLPAPIPAPPEKRVETPAPSVVEDFPPPGAPSPESAPPEKKAEAPVPPAVEHSPPPSVSAPRPAPPEKEPVTSVSPAIEHSPPPDVPVVEVAKSRESVPADLAVPAGIIPEGNRAVSAGTDDRQPKAPDSKDLPVESAQPADAVGSPARVMLAKAEGAVREGRISSPEGDNALALYKQAFALDGESDEIYASIFSAVEESLGRARTAAGKGEKSSARSYVDQARKMLQTVPKPPLKQYQASMRKYEAETGSILKNLSERPKQEVGSGPRTRVQRQATPPRSRVSKEEVPAGDRILKEDFPSGKKILREDFPPANR